MQQSVSRRYESIAGSGGLPRDNTHSSRRKRPFFSRRRDTPGNAWERLGTPNFSLAWFVKIEMQQSVSRRYESIAGSGGLPRDNTHSSRRKRPFFSRRRDTPGNAWERLGTPNFSLAWFVKIEMQQSVSRRYESIAGSGGLPRDNTHSSRRKRPFFSRRRDTPGNAWERLGTPNFSLAWFVKIEMQQSVSRRYESIAGSGGLPRDNTQSSRRKRPFFSRRRDTLYIRLIVTNKAKVGIARLRGLPKSARWLPRECPQEVSPLVTPR